MQNVENAFINSNYRTIAEYLYYTYKDSHIRNKFGAYTHLIKQDLNENELRLILQKQKEFGNSLITENFETELFEIFRFKEGLPSFEEKVGDCALEPNYKRAPKDSISACLFRAWQDLNHLRYQESIDSPVQTLSLEQRKKLIQLAFDKANEGKKPTESQICKIIGIKPFDKIVKEKKIKEYLMNYEMKKIEKSLTFTSYEKLKKVCEENNFTIWEQIKDNDVMIDSIIYVIAYLKEFKNLLSLKDPIIKEQINHLNLSDEIWEKLFDSLSFDGTMGHSLQAIWHLLPYFQIDTEEPLTYDKCVEQVYPNIFNNRHTEDNNFVPKFNEYDITNPVVKRTLNQTRLLINKLIAIYGKPSQINIELARDLGKTFSDREKLTEQMKENRNNNHTYWKEAQKLGIKDPIIYRLWKEQGEQCIYSGKFIGSSDLQFNNVEIDHILPISRSGDDSMMNKVLVFSSENQHKGNKTAFEYFQSKGNNELECFKVRVKNSHLNFKKKERLLLENFDSYKSQDYKTRHLNDTRYIAQALKNHLDATIRPKEQDYNYIKTISGQAISVLRKLWGFKDKDRQESHKHHAFDAILIAGAGSKIKAWEKDITNILKYRYNDDKGLSLGEKAQHNIKRFGLHIELPWENFASDARCYMANVFVSRMGKQKITGEMHKDTIKSKRLDGTIIKTIKLHEIEKPKWNEQSIISILDNMIDKERNYRLYETILAHSKSHQWNMTEAFNQDNAPSMPVKKNNPLHIPKIRKIKIHSSASSSLILEKMSSETRHAVVDSGDVVRLDLFRNSKGKFEAIPVYAFHYNELPEPDKEGFIFSIYKNDYLFFEADKEFANGSEDKIYRENVKMIEGYYASRNTGKIKLRKHDHQSLYIISYSSMKKITKYHIDILGRKHFIASSDTPQSQRLTLKEQQELWALRDKKWDKHEEKE